MSRSSLPIFSLACKWSLLGTEKKQIQDNKTEYNIVGKNMQTICIYSCCWAVPSSIQMSLAKQALPVKLNLSLGYAKQKLG